MVQATSRRRIRNYSPVPALSDPSWLYRPCYHGFSFAVHQVKGALESHMIVYGLQFRKASIYSCFLSRIAIFCGRKLGRS